MTDVETELRRMLHDEASSVSTGSGPPAPRLRRARLRRLRNGSGTALVAVALVVAGSAALAYPGEPELADPGEPDRVKVVTRPSPVCSSHPDNRCPSDPGDDDAAGDIADRHRGAGQRLRAACERHPAGDPVTEVGRGREPVSGSRVVGSPTSIGGRPAPSCG